MDQELKRIKQRDFSKIDQTLFDNVSRTDNLNFTLTHLSEFQKFLMEQISALNGPTTHNQKDNKIADSLVRTFDHLKQSIMKCSSIRDRTNKNKYKKLVKQINQLKKNQSKSIKTIVEQKDKLYKKTKQDFQKVTNILIHKYEQEKKKNQQLLQKISNLQQQGLKVKQQKTVQPSKIKQQLKSVMEDSKNRIEKHIQNYMKQKGDALKQIKMNKQNVISKYKFNQDRYGSGYKITQEKVTSNYVSDVSVYSSKPGEVSTFDKYLEKTPINTPLRKSIRNHRSSSLSNLQDIKDKQNSNMLLKGDIIQSMKRGKSKQKIKLCSMF